MSAFTMYLYKVLDHTEDIGLNSYPIFDEDYREGLNKKIIDHYWNREIGQETIEMFTFAMKRKMNEIMPYFNQLYESERLAYDPLKNISMSQIQDFTSTDSQTGTSNDSGTVESETTGNTSQETDRTVTDNGNTETDTTNDSSSRVVGSDFPQVQLSGNTDYASNAADSTGKDIGNTTTNEDNTSVTDETVTGTSGENSETTTINAGSTTNEGEAESHSELTNDGFNEYPADLIMRYRNTFLNIDMQVIDALSSLFMLLWDTGDAYTSRGYYYV